MSLCAKQQNKTSRENRKETGKIPGVFAVVSLKNFSSQTPAVSFVGYAKVFLPAAENP